MAKQLHLSDDRPFDKLLKELEEVYPAPAFGPADSIEKIMYVSGQRSVIEYLQAKQEN